MFSIEINFSKNKQVSKNNFPKDIDLEVGMEFIANSPEGEQKPFIVKEIKNHEVKRFRV